MSKVLVTDTNLTNIANAIRSKNNSSNTYKPNQMATAINNLPINTSNTGTYQVGSLLQNYRVFGNSKQTQLPTEYQEVEYISSTSFNHNSNYIDTGIYPTNNTNIETKFNLPSSLSHSYDRLFGSSSNFAVEGANTGASIFLYRYGTQSQNGSNIIAKDTEYVLKKTANKFYLDNELIIEFTEETFTDTSTLRLFSNPSGNRDSALRIYYTKIWENNVLVRNMVPCYRKSDNVIGMYDLVNNVFYDNDGTGTFTKGSDLPNPSYPQTITSVGDLVTSGEYTGKYKIPVTNSGKNLAYTGWAENFVTRINDTQKAKIESKDGRNCLLYTANAGSGDYDNKYIFKINWKENTQYKFSFDIFYNNSYKASNLALVYTDETVTYLWDGTTTDWESRTIISSANKTIKYLRAQWYSGSCYLDLDTFMVKELDVGDDTYEPYRSITTNIYLDEPLRGMNSIKDYTDFAIQKRTNKIKKVTLSAGTHTLSDAKANGNYMCTQQVSGTLNEQVLTLNTGVTNADVYYELETPTEETITIPELELWEGTNIITIGTEVEATQQITYISKN